MGGFGSGQKLKKKTTVEECLQLDAGRFSKTTWIIPGLYSSGELTWTSSHGRRLLSLHFSLEPKAKDWAILNIATLLQGNGSEPVIESIPLVGTIPNFGGVRWWFLCPLVHAGVTCNRRVKKLFLPPRGQYFGCRASFDLTYESAQSHDPRVGKLMKDPYSVIAAINSEDPMQSLRGLEAYAKLRGWL